MKTFFIFLVALVATFANLAVASEDGDTTSAWETPGNWSPERQPFASSVPSVENSSPKKFSIVGEFGTLVRLDAKKEDGQDTLHSAMGVSVHARPFLLGSAVQVDEAIDLDEGYLYSFSKKSLSRQIIEFVMWASGIVAYITLVAGLLWEAFSQRNIRYAR